MADTMAQVAAASAMNGKNGKKKKNEDLVFPIEDFGLETAQSKLPIPARAAGKTAARRVLGPPGQVISELADPSVAAAPTMRPMTLPAGSPSSTEKDRSNLITSMWQEVPEEMVDFEQVLTPPPGFEDRLKRKLSRKKTDTAGSQKNKSILLKPKSGVLLPPIRIGTQKVQDWINRVEGVLSKEEIIDAAKWYRSGKMLQPFMRTVGPADTPEIESGFLIGSQQKTPSSALMSYLRQREQARRGVKYDDRKKSGQQDRPLFELASGETITGGAGQKIYDFYDSAMQNPSRTFYGNDSGAGAPFVVDVHSFRDMGYIDKTFKEFLEKNYKIPKGVLLEMDKPDGAPSETQYEKAADAGRALTEKLNQMGYGEMLGIGNLMPADVQAIGWIALSRIYDAPGQDVPVAVEKNVQRVSAELSFGDGAPYNQMFPEYANLSPEQQYRVTRETMAWVGDRANELSGTLNIGRVHGSGGFENYPPQPAMVESLLATPEGADLYAGIVGYLAQQTEVWAVKEVTSESAAENGIAIDIMENDSNRIKKGNNLINIWNQVNQVNPDVFKGYQPIVKDGKPGMRVIVPFKYNPFNTKKKLREYLSGIGGELVEAVDQIFPGDGNFTIETKALNIRFNENDWTVNKNGESHLKNVSGIGGKALADSLRNSHRPEFEAFLRDRLSRSTSRIDRLQGIPDTKDFSRSIPPRRRLVLPGETSSTVFGEEQNLQSYESARQAMDPILDKSKRQHNFNRWWNWDFEEDKAGDTPSAATLRMYYNEKEGDIAFPITGPGGEYSQDDEGIDAKDLDKPLMFYHGSPNFQGTQFDKEKQGLRDHGYLGKGFYFSPKPITAEHYAESVGENLVEEETPGPMARVFAEDVKGNRLEQIDEFTFDNTDFYDSEFPKNADGLKAYVEDQYSGDSVQIEMDEKNFSPEILPFYLSIKNPLNMSPGKFTDEMLGQLKEGFFQAMTWTDHALTNEEAEKLFQQKASEIKLPWQYIENLVDYLGVDSGSIDMAELAQEAGFDAIVGGNEVVVFNPKQIKSATGNIGLFNPRSDDFLTQLEKKNMPAEITTRAAGRAAMRNRAA